MVGQLSVGKANRRGSEPGTRISERKNRNRSGGNPRCNAKPKGHKRGPETSPEIPGRNGDQGRKKGKVDEESLKEQKDAAAKFGCLECVVDRGHRESQGGGEKGEKEKERQKIRYNPILRRRLLQTLSRRSPFMYQKKFQTKHVTSWWEPTRNFRKQKGPISLQTMGVKDLKKKKKIISSRPIRSPKRVKNKRTTGYRA